MVVLAFDPGKHIGWAFVEEMTSPRYRYVRGGVLEAYSGKLDDRTGDNDFQLQLSVKKLMVGTAGPPMCDWVAVERHLSRVAPQMQKHLMFNAELEGGLTWLAFTLGIDTFSYPASMWRRGLLGEHRKTRGVPGDKEIREYLEGGVIENIPKLLAKERPHVYDAIGLAMYSLATRHLQKEVRDESF